MLGSQQITSRGYQDDRVWAETLYDLIFIRGEPSVV